MAKDKIDVRKKYRVSEKLSKHYGETYPHNIGADYYGRSRYIEGLPGNAEQRKYLDFGTNKRGALKHADKEARKRELMDIFHNTEEFSERSINESDPQLETYYRKKKTGKSKPKKRKASKKKGCGCK